jgi:hypothetical protein
MTRIQMIQALGDLLTRLDVVRGSPLPNDPNRQVLDDLRLLLDDRQRRLSREQLDEGTAAFRAAEADLARLNGEVRQTIDGIDDQQRSSPAFGCGHRPRRRGVVGVL